MPTKRITIFNEYPGQESDSMAADLAVELARQHPDWKVVSVNGLLRKYTPGGLRPSRLLNWFYLHLRAVWEALWHGPEYLMVVSSPPFIQLTAALVSQFRGVKVISWLMDYHPEMEARMVEQRAPRLRFLAAFLRRIDRAALARTFAVVTLDPAMKALVQAQGFTGRILVHPTWTPQAVRALARISGDTPASPVRLLFVGNLGQGHTLQALRELLQVGPPASLLALGASPGALQAFQEIASAHNAPFTGFGRLPFAEFKQRMADYRPNYGLVLIHPRSAGIVSPSKFVTYLQQGIPLLYIGPEGTNAWLACIKFHAGVALTPGSSELERVEAAKLLSDPQAYGRFKLGTEQALEFFNGHNAATLADRLNEALF